MTNLQDKFEKKNLEILQEVSNALKQLNIEKNLQKQRFQETTDDLHSRIDLFKEESEKKLENLKEHQNYKDQQIIQLLNDKNQEQKQNLQQKYEDILNKLKILQEQTEKTINTQTQQILEKELNNFNELQKEQLKLESNDR